MKLFKTIIKALVFPALFITAAQAQTNNAKALIDGQNFVFRAQSVTPQTGNLRQLNNDYYTLRITKDAITSDLPYFGRAYTAPIDPTQGGMQFTSKKFDYSVKEKKRKWEITIKTKDVNDAAQMQLTVYDNGTAYLQVNSTNRQPISYNGVIEEKK